MFPCFCVVGVLKCYVMLQLFGNHLYCTSLIAIASVVFICVLQCFMFTVQVSCIIASCSLSLFPFLTSCFYCQCSMLVSHVYFTMWNYHASSPRLPVFIFQGFWGYRKLAFSFQFARSVSSVALGGLGEVCGTRRGVKMDV